MMKKNSFSKTTKTIFANITIAKYFLCVLLFLPLFFAAAPPENEQPPQQEPTKMFVVGDMKISGAENLSYVEIVPLEIVETAPKTKVASAKSQKTITKKNKTTASEIIEIKYIAQKQKISNTSIANSTKSDADFLQKLGSSSAAVAPANHYQKLQSFAATAMQKEHAKIFIASKQKFYTTLSYLQFGNSRSCSLRAPPC